MLGFVAGIVPILLIICVIVTFHELGHFSVAKLFHTRIERFSVGFGKILLRKKDKSGVEWCLSAIPLGGYVKFAGDNSIASMVPGRDELEAARESITAREGADAVKDYYHFKPLWQRFLIILAGPGANFVLAILIFTFINLIVGEAIVTPTVSKVMPGSAAESAGFKLGDTIKSVDGHDVQSDLDVRRLIMLRADTPISIVVDRNHAIVTLHATPHRALIDSGDKSRPSTGGVLGVELHGAILTRRLNPVEALVKGNNETWQVLDTNLTYISRIFTGKENGDQIGGIIGMTKTAGDIAVDVAQTQETVWHKVADLLLTYMGFTAFISIGIGFLNLMPIPALDGGHLAFYLYQSVTKKPVPSGIQNAAFPIAIVLVLGLMVFAAWNDINHTGLARFLGGLFS